MSTVEKVAELAGNACVGAFALAMGDAGGVPLVVGSLAGLGLLACLLGDERAGQVRTIATREALAAIRSHDQLGRADLDRAAYMLTDAPLRAVTPGALLGSIATDGGTEPARLMGAVLASHLSPGGGDLSTIAIVRAALDAATAACAVHQGFRDGLRNVLLMPLVREGALQDHFLSEQDARLDRLMADLEPAARELGLTKSLFAGLARRVNETVEDANSARLELERATRLAAELRDRASLPSPAGDPVVGLLRRLAALNDRNRLDEGADLISAHLARPGARKTRLLDIAVIQETLRRDAVSAARLLIVRLRIEAPPDTFEALRALQDKWYVSGRDCGLDFEAEVAIHLAEALQAEARTADQRGSALSDLGMALASLGQRQRGTSRLEGAVAAFRAALEERNRDRVPLDWALTQMNLGSALATLGQREPGTGRLTEAVIAFGAVLEVWTRDRAPLDWAVAQMNLGSALSALGEREPGTLRLEDAVVAFRAALTGFPRDGAPLDWAMAQTNLGAALLTLGARGRGSARHEEAVAAYRAALTEFPRDRAPMDWATAQMNLGHALLNLGEREPGTERLEEAAAACRAALQEFPRGDVPLDWATTTGILALSLLALADRQEDPSLALDGLRMLREAEALMRGAGHVIAADSMSGRLPAAEALIARLTGAAPEQAGPETV